MTAESLKILGCPTCGFRIGEGDSSCPRCGHSFAEGDKLECPFCGEPVDHGMTACPSCHVNYSEFKEKTVLHGGDEAIDQLLLDIIKLEAVSAKHETKKFSCPSCSWLLDGTELRCPRCAKDLAEDVSLQCPICGSTVAADSPRCPDCGCSFEETAAPDELAQTETPAPQAVGTTETEDFVDGASAQVQTVEPAADQPVEPAPTEVGGPEFEAEPDEKTQATTGTVDDIDSESGGTTDKAEEETKPRVIPKPLAKPKHIVALKVIAPQQPAEEGKATPSGGQKKGKLRKLKTKPKQEQ